MQDIFSLTQRTVKGDEEEVVLQALEFWCTVAEEELEREGVSRAGVGGERGELWSRVGWGAEQQAACRRLGAGQAGGCRAQVAQSVAGTVGGAEPALHCCGCG